MPRVKVGTDSGNDVEGHYEDYAEGPWPLRKCESHLAWHRKLGAEPSATNRLATRETARVCRRPCMSDLKRWHPLWHPPPFSAPSKHRLRHKSPAQGRWA
jgi:hypothetical protein